MTEKRPTKARIWPCPKCKAPCRFDDTNPFRPFCSERCRCFDTASWATDNYRIPGPAVDPQQGLEERPSASEPDDSEHDS